MFIMWLRNGSCCVFGALHSLCGFAQHRVGKVAAEFSSVLPWASASILIILQSSAIGVELGTRWQTVKPLDVPSGAPPLAPSNVSQYVSAGYGVWTFAAGTNEGVRFDLMPPGYTGTTHEASLLSYFSISDIHITDKESPAQVPFAGWRADFLDGGPGGLYQSAYSPVFLSTTHVLDAAIRTVNAINQLAPLDFGISLGDVCNASQFNELRWFIDVMDGAWIRPSSGDHLGETNIDYQMPYQAAGLDSSIPWYEVIGNHDQFWMGIGYPTPKIQQAFVGSHILEIDTNSPLSVSASEGQGMFVGTVDGTTPLGEVVKWGATNLYATPPTVAADSNRHSITIDIPSPTNFIEAFFNSTSLPPGHGFNRTNEGSTAACYSFLPLTNLPLKVIVLDDTCKSNKMDQSPTFYGGGWVDEARFAWLTNELQLGQEANQLMIIACHIPIDVQNNINNTDHSSPQFPPFSGNHTDADLIATLHNYPNLLLVMAGHRHLNTVTPHPSPDPAHPEFGFWEVETPSLRDFPQQLRVWEILRNRDNSISILTTDVDPVVQTNTPAGKSRNYAVGAGRIYGNTELTNTISHTYNVELLKVLSADMQAVMATYGRPLGHRLAIAPGETGREIRFLGSLRSKDALSDPDWSAVQDATNSPFTMSEASNKKFYQATE